MPIKKHPKNASNAILSRVFSSENHIYWPKLRINFLRQQAGTSQPFCLALSWGPPHDPYDQVPAAYRNQYDPRKVVLRPNVRPDSTNALARGLDCRRVTADYYAAITALDHELGRLLEALDNLGMADNTLVVFTSDHGDMLWSHGLMKKQTPYEESILVPFIARFPGRIPGGETRSMPMGTVDIAPTLAGWLGWNVPPQWEGRDFSTTTLGGDDESVFIANHGCYDEAVIQHISEWRGVRTARHTYAETVGRCPWLLFDNQADPFQLQNLVNDDRHAEIQERLRTTLGQWLQRTGDPFLPTEQMMDQYGISGLWRKRELEMHPPGSDTETIVAVPPQ
ncbi:MAG: sulfatase-like hydrolase/transferase [Phycisphaerae bacterium]